ncbi:MAG: BglG family transcription antiterminator [Clostridiaceae bacterium]|nr:BglG family transcription antiterminator [Clostridiaceae bacterium]
MDKQDKFILETLIEEDNYITYSYISKKLNVSLSTVIRYIKSLDFYFRVNNIKVEKKRGIGMRIILSEEERKRLKESLDDKGSDYLSPYDRKIIIICELLKMNEPVKLYYFSSILKVAIGTVSRDLEEVERWAEENSLKLIRGRGNGIFVEGEEISIREAIVNILLSCIDEKNIYYWNDDFINPKFFKESIAPLTKMKLAELIDYEIVVDMIMVVEKYDSNLKEILVDSSHFILIIFLALIIQRKNKDFVIEEYKINNIRMLHQYSYITALIRDIEKHHNLEVSTSDIYIIMIHFITSRIRNISLQNSQIVNDIELSVITNKIISKIQEDLNIRLDYDDDLLVRLMVHLKLMLERQSMNIKVSNNYLDTIKAEYKHIFDVVKDSVNFLEELNGKELRDEEIGFITIHVAATIVALENNSHLIKAAVVCTSGIGTSKILVEKVKQQIKSIEITDTISSSSLNEAKLLKQGVDLIISTVNLETFAIPAVVVNPLLMHDDILKIYDSINTIAKKRNIHLSKQVIEKQKPVKCNAEEESVDDMLFYLEVIRKIIDNFYYEENVEVNSKDELIEHISEQLSDSSEIQLTIRKGFIKREQHGSTVIDEQGLILMHCRADSYIKLGIVKLKKSIEVTVGRVKLKVSTVLIMIVPEEVDDRIAELFSEISKELIENDAFMKEVISGSKNNILNNVGKLLTRFIM